MTANQGTAVLLLREDGKFLMQRRGRGCGIGMWSVPGGRREPGEKCIKAAIREVKEEVGVHILLVRHILETCQVHPCCGEKWETHWYVTRNFIGQPRESDEATKLFWADWEVMPSPIWYPFAMNLRAIQECLTNS